MQVFVPQADHAQRPYEVGPLAGRPLLHLVGLFNDPGPRFAEGLDGYLDIPELVIAIDGVLIVYAAFQLETGARDIGNNPVGIPHRLDVLWNRARSEYEIGVLLVATRKVGSKMGEDERVG